MIGVSGEKIGPPYRHTCGECAIVEWQKQLYYLKG